MFATTNQPWYFHDIPSLCLQLPKTFDDSSLEIFLSAGKIAVFFCWLNFDFCWLSHFFCWYLYSRYFPLYPDISHYIKIFPMFARYFHHIQISITMNSLWQSNMAMEKNTPFRVRGERESESKMGCFPLSMLREGTVLQISVEGLVKQCPSLVIRVWVKSDPTNLHD